VPETHAEAQEQGEKKERGIDAEMGAEEDEGLFETNGEFGFETAAFAKVDEGDPLVPLVPKQGWDEADEGDEEGEIKAGTPPLPAPGGDEGEDEGDGKVKGEIGVFAEGTETDGESGEEPPMGVSGGFFQGPPEGIDGEEPEENGERVDGHEERADIENGETLGEDGGPEADAFVVDATGEGEDEKGGAEAEEGTKKAHPKLGRAKKVGGGENGHGDAGPLGVVGEIGTLGPEVVIGFVGRKLEAAAKKEAQEGEHAEEDEEDVEAVFHARR